MGRLHGLWQLLLLPCQGMSALTSRALDERLKPSERVALRVHLLTCAPCRRFARQIQMVGEALQRVAGDLHHEEEIQTAASLPDDVRARIKQRLEQEG